MTSKKRIFLTGGCGFIGYHLSDSLLQNGHKVYCIDNLNSYYSQKLKNERLSLLEKYEEFEFELLDISDYKKLFTSLENFKPDLIINLAAQAGVRYSQVNPASYIASNIIGYSNLLECARNLNLKRIIYASSSSVYGECDNIPFKEKEKNIKPLSLYASTKYTNELISKNYHDMFGISFVGLRFFTVYGDYGRPDMAYFDFTKKAINEEEITIFNKGEMSRDMTHISDILQGINSSIEYIMLEGNPINEIFNLGNKDPVSLWDLINLISRETSKKIKYKFEDTTTEVKTTFADISKAEKILNYNPKVSYKEGMKNFVQWLLSR
tara:strand:+ start:593 stop:1561 length:969 start_codon:yes stop_codon:yes gene_type:complete